MEFSIDIILSNKFDSNMPRYELVKDPIYGFILKLYLKPTDNYEDVIHDYDKMKEDIANVIEENKLYDDNNYSYLESFITETDENLDIIFNEYDFIKIFAEPIEIKKFLNDNPYLKQKKIILQDRVDINYDIRPLLELFKDFNNIYLDFKDNEMPITLEEFKKTQDRINEIYNEITKYNFSPLEIVLYIYDIVRDRKYIKENKDDLPYESRDLTKVLFGNKIVCKGYANIIKTLLDKFNIKNISYEGQRKDDPEKWHAFNAVYLKDDKYEIDGVYFLDATADRKMDDTNNHFLRYPFLLKTKSELDELHKFRYIDKTLPLRKKVLSSTFIYNLKEFGLNNLNKEEMNTINTISSLIDGKKIITSMMLYGTNHFIPDFLKEEYNIDEIISKLLHYKELFNKKINASKMLKALFNVRKSEYYKDPKKYAFEINAFYQILFRSKWLFITDGELKLLKIIFGKGFNINGSLITDMDNYVKENNLDKEIENIKLAKTLRLIYEKKK